MDYLIEISGNEDKFEQCIAAIENDHCFVNEDGNLQTKPESAFEFHASHVVDYFLQTRPFHLAQYQSFFYKIRMIKNRGFELYSYCIKDWFEQKIISKYYDILENEWEYYEEKKVRNTRPFEPEDLNLLKFICSIAIEHMKYDFTTDTVSAGRYFKYIEQLAPELIEHLKKYGSETLDQTLTFYADEQLECRANDAFGTIDIHAQDDSEQTYLKALTFINALLKTDFPRSFAINFESPSKHILAVPDLQLCGQHYLFAGAVQYVNLHPLIVEYIELSSKKFEWYSNVDEEECAMPGTFAVFALALNDAKYFPVVEQYFKVVDDGHQSIQKHVTPVFVEKYGINEHSLPLFLRFIRSMQEHPPHPVFIQHFQNRENLALLLQYKDRFADYDWEYVLYSIFGRNSDSDRLSVEFSPKLWEIYLNIRAPRDEDFEPADPFDFEEDEEGFEDEEEDFEDEEEQ